MKKIILTIFLCFFFSNYAFSERGDIKVYSSAPNFIIFDIEIGDIETSFFDNDELTKHFTSMWPSSYKHCLQFKKKNIALISSRDSWDGAIRFDGDIRYASYRFFCADDPQEASSYWTPNEGEFISSITNRITRYVVNRGRVKIIEEKKKKLVKIQKEEIKKLKITEAQGICKTLGYKVNTINFSECSLKVLINLPSAFFLTKDF